MTKFMGPIGAAITAIGALVAMFGMVGKRRQETFDAVGKGGLLGVGVDPRTAYNRLSSQLSNPDANLSSTMGFKSGVMGLNYEKNLETIKSLVSNGVGLGTLGKCL